MTFCIFFFFFAQVIRGLVMDKERGNLVKADRFGYVKRAMHGTKMLSTRAIRCVCCLLVLQIILYLVSMLEKFYVFHFSSVV